MVRAFLTAAAALLMLGAARPPSVDYRLGLAPQRGAPPLVEVEIRFAGDADGETRLDLPNAYGGTREAWRNVTDLKVKGASVAEDGPGARLLRHRPGAPLTVRYRVRSAYAEDPKGADGNPYKGPIVRPDWFALLGEFVFAVPDGRAAEAATFRWGKLPKGWRGASDLDHAAMGRPMSVDDVVQSISLAGPGLQVIERPIPGGTVRLATIAPAADKLAKIADSVAPVVAAQRGFWNDVQGPYFVAFVPLQAKPSGYSVGGDGRGDGFVLYASAGAEDRLAGLIGHEHTHTWIPARTGRMPPEAEEAAVYWFSEGFADFFADRTLARAGLITAAEAVERMNTRLAAYERSPVRPAPAARILADFWKDEAVQQLSYQRGALLALKWDEELRQSSGGKLDLDDVILRMRDHYQQFAPGQGPDVVTGLVSAVWVTARRDIRPDIERYAVRGELVALPETLFGDCVYLRTDRRPTFDAGFDAAASFAAKQLKGVRTRGPAWNSGLRNGQRLDAWTFKAGDTSQEVLLTVRDGRGRAKVVRFWPYGDDVVERHALALRPRMTPEETAACGRKIGGL